MRAIFLNQLLVLSLLSRSLKSGIVSGNVFGYS